MEDKYNNGYNPMDNSLKRGLENYSESPPDSAWQAINAGRKAAIMAPAKGGAALVFRWAAKAVVVLSTILGVIFWNTQNQISEIANSVQAVEKRAHKEQMASQAHSNSNGSGSIASTETSKSTSWNDTDKTGNSDQTVISSHIDSRNQTGNKPAKSVINPNDDGSKLMLSPEIPELIAEQFDGFSYELLPLKSESNLSESNYLKLPDFTRNKIYFGATVQGARLSGVNYRKLPPPDPKNRDHQLYNERIVKSIRHSMGLAVGLLFPNGLILESGAYQSSFTVTQIHTGRFDPMKVEKQDGKHEYDAQIRTAGGYRDCEAKLKPKHPSQNPPKPFDVALKKEETFNSLDIPINIGYGFTQNRWFISGRLGSDISLIKQKQIQLTVDEVSSEEYDISLSDISLSSPISDSYKTIFGMHAWASAEYRPYSYLGLQASLGGSIELKKAESNLPQRKWVAGELMVKWYL